MGNPAHPKIRIFDLKFFSKIIPLGEAAVPLETTRRAIGNQEKSKQRSAIVGLRGFESKKFLD